MWSLVSGPWRVSGFDFQVSSLCLEGSVGAILEKLVDLSVNELAASVAKQWSDDVLCDRAAMVQGRGSVTRPGEADACERTPKLLRLVMIT